MAGFTEREVPTLPEDPNSGDFSISGLGSFGSLYVSGISTLSDLNVSSGASITRANVGILTATDLNVSSGASITRANVGILTATDLNVSSGASITRANVGILTATDLYLSRFLYDRTNSTGSANQILTSDGSGVKWSDGNTLTGASANQVIYKNSSGIGTGSNNLKFDGTNLNIQRDIILGDPTSTPFYIGRGKNNINSNTSFGDRSLNSVTSGFDNTSIGYLSMRVLTEGVGNVSIGAFTFNSLTTGDYNIAIGPRALESLTVNDYNIAIGRESQYYTNSPGNTSVGYKSLYINDLGTYNTAIGYEAGSTSDGSDFSVGNSSGTNNIFIGYRAVNTSGGATANNTIVLGNSSITTLRCNTSTISALSDERDKKEIEDIDLGLNFVLDLRPVKFKWNQRDGGRINIPDSGFIAQESLKTVSKYKAEWFGLVDNQNPDHFEMANSKLIPVIVKSIQEQQKIIDDLNDTIIQLKQRLDSAGIG